MDPREQETVRKSLEEKYPGAEIASLEDITKGLDTRIYSFFLETDTEFIPLVARVFPEKGSIVRARREYELQRALRQTGIPVPATYTYGEFEDRTSFMVMQKVPGQPLMKVLPNDPGLGYLAAFIETQVRIHGLPPDLFPMVTKAKLEDPKGIAKNMIFWLTAYSKRNKITAFDRIIQWLKDNLDQSDAQFLSLCHNDYHPLNIMVDGEKLYVIDWSNATISDFRYDLGYTLITLASGTSDPSVETGVQKLYERASGREIGSLDFFKVAKTSQHLLMGYAMASGRNGAIDQAKLATDFVDHFKYFKDRVLQITKLDLPELEAGF